MKIYTKICDKRKPIEITRGLVVNYVSRSAQQVGGGIYIPYFFANSDNCSEFKDELFKFLENWFPEYVEEWKVSNKEVDKKGFLSIPSD